MGLNLAASWSLSVWCVHVFHIPCSGFLPQSKDMQVHMRFHIASRCECERKYLSVSVCQSLCVCDRLPTCPDCTLPRGALEARQAWQKDGSMDLNFGSFVIKNSHLTYDPIKQLRCAAVCMIKNI